MHRYKPLRNEMDVPYVPENFIDILAQIARDGYLFPERALLQVRIVHQQLDSLRIHIVDRDDVLLLRFDTLEVWRVNDHTLRYTVSYLGWLLTVPFGQSILTAARYILVIGLSLIIRNRAHELGKLFHLSHEEMEGDSGVNTRPVSRPIGKRLKEIAAVLPA